MASLPPRVQTTWPHYELGGAELELHGWQHIGAEIHLRVTLPDGSIGCLSANWSDLLEQGDVETRPLPAGRCGRRMQVAYSGPRG